MRGGYGKGRRERSGILKVPINRYVAEYITNRSGVAGPGGVIRPVADAASVPAASSRQRRIDARVQAREGVAALALEESHIAEVADGADQQAQCQRGAGPARPARGADGGQQPALKATSAAQASSAVPTAAVPAADGGTAASRPGASESRRRAPAAAGCPVQMPEAENDEDGAGERVAHGSHVCLCSGAAVGSGPGRRLEDIPSSPAARRRRQHSGKR